MMSWLRPMLARLLGHLTLVLTLAGLAGLAWLGHLNEWKTPAFSDLWKKADKPEEDKPDEEAPSPLPVDDTTPSGPPSPTASSLEKLPPRITLESPATAARAGFRLAPVLRRTMSQQVQAYGVLDYDQTRYAHLSTRTPGTAWCVLKGMGDRARKGDVLAVIESTDVGKAKAEFLQSLVQVDVRKKFQDLLATGQGASAKMKLDAETAVSEAHIKLLTDQQTLANLGLPVQARDLVSLPLDQRVRQVRLLGLPAELLQDQALLKGHDPEMLPANLLPLKAPWDGMVINRNIVEGELASPATPQFTLANLGQLWVMLDVRSEEASRLKEGQEVVFVPDGVQEEKAEGKIDWISSEVDPKTRTVRVRAPVANPDHRLRPHTFGDGRITVRSQPYALAVPNEALQADGPLSLVFVRIDDQTFEWRRVQTGLKDDKYTEILSGLAAGELVVTTGSFVLKTELFKDRLGGDD